ncbi:MAG: glycoside hydrolase family 3 N-terminal domain-containing protein [Desulfosarcinaceae bacterium]|nr:glycoside hydrolase family 3 N-terminal domain-containing protein [Desulfosarcinaceae bacterium]
MPDTLRQNAHAVILPAISSLHLSDAVKRLLSGGGCSLLLGETREEYLAREMARARKVAETPDRFTAFTQQATSLTDHLLIAVDQEIAGICRLHDLVPPFPSVDALQRMPADEFQRRSSQIATAARALGINCFLGPILDIVGEPNPWLAGRTWSTDPHRIATLSAAYIRGVQRCGIAAAAKHFPGYAAIGRDPATDPNAAMTGSMAAIETGFIPFKAAIENAVEIIMTGPAIVEGLDPRTPASLSAPIIQILKRRLHFRGVVLSDDLDSQATLRGRSVAQVAIDALAAGSDLLLMADLDHQLDIVVNAIQNAVNAGHLSRERLDAAADTVRRVARRYA